MTDPRAPREIARQAMPEPLRREVRLLGELLGQVLREYGGDELLADVERLRRAVIAARTGTGPSDEVVALTQGWSLQRADDVARAFTVYFHLANLAEEHHRVRVLRSRDADAGRLGDSLATSVAEVRRLHGDDRLAALIGGLRLHPVLTAHPTEARRRAVVSAISRVSEQLDSLDDPRVGATQRADARRLLLEEIDILWRTAHLRSTSVDPLDEVRTAMAVFDETLFLVVPLLYRAWTTCCSARRPVRSHRPRVRSSGWAAGSAPTATAIRTSPRRSPARRWPPRPATCCSPWSAPLPGSAGR